MCDDLDSEDAPKVGGCVCCVLILVASATMLGLSFSTLNPHEFGLNKNDITGHLQAKTYTNGRHFLGLGHRFIKFPRNLQYIEFSQSADGGANNQAINAWSADGQELFLEIGFYYQLRADAIDDLFYRHGENFVPIIEDIASNVFREVTTEFNTIDFFEKRAEIDAEMRAKLQARLSVEVFVDVPRFNLLSITVPTRFNDAVVQKVITQQEATTLQFLQQAETTRASSRAVVAENEQLISVIRATLEANATQIVANAQAEATTLLNTQKAVLLKDLAVGLGFTSGGTTVDAEPLLKFLYTELISSSKTSSVTVNLPSALFSLA